MHRPCRRGRRRSGRPGARRRRWRSLVILAIDQGTTGTTCLVVDDELGIRGHVTDATNASRTMLLGLDTLEWDEQLLALFGIDPSVLPRVVGSAEAVGEGEVLGTTLPVAGIAGDQQ